jgi:hypothetical protein
MGSALKIGNTSYLPAAITLGGDRLSGVMPFTWLVQVPGLSAFREADRFTLLGMVPAALLGGSALGWLAARARPLLGQLAPGSPGQAGPIQADPIQADPGPADARRLAPRGPASGPDARPHAAASPSPASPGPGPSWPACCS